MGDSVAPVPEGFSTITPYLVVHDASAAIAFYVKAFGAVERLRIDDADGRRLRHAELQVGASRLFITDVPLSPETRIPRGDDTSSVWLYLYVPDPDALFDKAVAAGADVVTPLGDQPWGDRYGCVLDPFGYRWGIAARRESLSADELKKRMAATYRAD